MSDLSCFYLLTLIRFPNPRQNILNGTGSSLAEKFVVIPNDTS